MLANCIFQDFQAQFQPKRPEVSDNKTIVIYGAPCTGKTTLSKRLSESYNAYRLSMDMLRKAYPVTELFSDRNNNEILNLFIQKLQFLNTHGQNVICEGFFYSNERRAKLIEAVRKRPIFIYLTAPLAVLYERLEIRNTNSYEEKLSCSNLTYDQLDKFWHLFNPKGADLIIDTSKVTITQAFNYISRKARIKI
jgi:predicted kinase